MLKSGRILLALSVAALLLAVSASVAAASEPTSGTVRVEGLAGTLLSRTSVTTTTEPVVNDGKPSDSCPGTSAIGALQGATGGNWGGPWSEKYLQYTVGTIEGESHEFGSGYYWSFWLNHHEMEIGACEAPLEEGQEVLFFPCSESTACGLPLAVEAPTIAEVGQPVTVTVRRYAANGTSSLVEGATVSDGSVSAKTDANGRAVIALTSTGESTIRAEAAESIRDERGICVHDGNDGNCGTVAPVGSPAPTPPGEERHVPPPAPYRGPFALVAKVASLTDGRVYLRSRAPRTIAGTISSDIAVSSVSLELRREYRGRCYAYEGLRERFIRARCGHGSFFRASSGASFSYLLPSALAPGRYVLDVLATDVLGDRTTLARGTSRIVFDVR
jgi:hypothetical protein